MEIILETNNLVKAPIKNAFLKVVAKKILENSNYEFLNNKNVSISLAIVGKKEIKKLNKKYRKKNESTDVLSFSEYKNAEEIGSDKAKSVFLGELVLCYDDIEEYCRKNRLDLKSELSKTLAHGILHLLGFKHGKNMTEIQEKI